MAPAAGIRDVVQSNIPETFDALFGDGGVFDKEDDLDIVDLRTQLILGYFWPDGSKKESDLTTFQAAYLGDIVTRLVIPAAMDYYGVRTGRVDSTQPGSPGLSSSQRGAGTGRQNYDRIQMLKDVDALIAARLSSQLDAFLGTLEVVRPAGIAVSSSKDDLITVDPRLMTPPTWPYYRKATARALQDLGQALDSTIWPPYALGGPTWWISTWASA